jgi:hypothetical protein
MERADIVTVAVMAGHSRGLEYDRGEVGSERKKSGGDAAFHGVIRRSERAAERERL